MPRPDIRDAIRPLIHIARAADPEDPDELVVCSAFTDEGRVDITLKDCRDAEAAYDGPHELHVRGDLEWQLAHPLRCTPGLLDCAVHIIFGQIGLPEGVGPGSYDVSVEPNLEGVESLILRPSSDLIPGSGTPESEPEGGSTENPDGSNSK